MLKKTNFVILLGLLLAQASHSQGVSGPEALEKSIEYHDPNNAWPEFKDTFHFKQELSDNVVKIRKVYLDNLNGVFEFWSPQESGTMKYEVIRNKAKVFWNGSENIPSEIKTNFRLTKERALMYRDYYSYLYGLPMKLKDPGTLIEDRTEKVSFEGKTCIRVKVTYEPKTGGDTWYFYLDPETFALWAYQFYHNEEEGDGEYILLKELKEYSGIRIPRIRSWYMNSDHRFLATDILEY